MSEKRDISAKKSRDSNLLRDLYARHRDELLSYVRRRVGAGPPEPEDITQQAFANFAALEKPEAVENAGGFLFRTASNLIVNYYRRAAVGKQHLTAEKNLQEIFGTSDDLSPEIVLLDRERFQKVLDVVSGLPRRQRRFMLLNRVEGLSYSEIARRNGVSEATVRREVRDAVKACGAAVLAIENADDR